jgi:hypothetical protein
MVQTHEAATDVFKALRAAVGPNRPILKIEHVTGVVYKPISEVMAVACGTDPEDVFFIGVYRMDRDSGQAVLDQIAGPDHGGL